MNELRVRDGKSPARAALREEIARLEQRVAQAEERRRALVHIMGDLNESNRKLGDQRKAMLHILEDSHQSNQAGRQPQGDDPHHGRPA